MRDAAKEICNEGFGEVSVEEVRADTWVRPDFDRVIGVELFYCVRAATPREVRSSEER